MNNSAFSADDDEIIGVEFVGVGPVINDRPVLLLISVLVVVPSRLI